MMKEWITYSAVPANLTGLAREDTVCPSCGNVVRKGFQAYVTPWDAPDEYLNVAVHPMCGPQERIGE